jgi:hypothetical protein
MGFVISIRIGLRKSDHEQSDMTSDMRQSTRQLNGFGQEK